VALGLGGVQRPDRQELARIVPLVQRLGGVDPLVALEPDQPASQQLGEDLGHLRLADARLTLEQQRLVQREGEMDRGRESPIRQVGVRSQLGLELVDRSGYRAGILRRAHRANGTGRSVSERPPTLGTARFDGPHPLEVE
jgi:hypothetical protein